MGVGANTSTEGDNVVKHSPVKVHIPNHSDESSARLSKSPGSLPASASELSKAARGLLMRLLERDPRSRMRTLRQLQQSAFYMGYNFEHVKDKKISPKIILEKYFPEGPPQQTESTKGESEAFASFDQI